MLTKQLEGPKKKNPVWPFRNNFQNPVDPTTREATVTGTVKVRNISHVCDPETTATDIEGGRWRVDTGPPQQENPASLDPSGPTQTAKGGLASPAPLVNLNAFNWQNKFTPRTLAARDSGR